MQSRVHLPSGLLTHEWNAAIVYPQIPTKCSFLPPVFISGLPTSRAMSDPHIPAVVADDKQPEDTPLSSGTTPVTEETVQPSFILVGDAEDGHRGPTVDVERGEKASLTGRSVADAAKVEERVEQALKR